MSSAQTAAARFRFVLLILALACWLAGLFWIFDIVWPAAKFGDDLGPAGLMGVIGFACDAKSTYVAVAATYCGLFLISQWFFLGPRGGFRIRVSQTGGPMRLSVLIAALLAAMLTIGLFASLAELTGFWTSIIGKPSDAPSPRSWPLLAALCVSWAIWAIVFFIYWKQGTRATQLNRMLRGLFAGSILELVVSTPAHIIVLRSQKDGDQDCYCMRGTYTGLVLGGTVLLWTFGPGLVLLFLREKNRREPLLSPDAAARVPG